MTGRNTHYGACQIAKDTSARRRARRGGPSHLFEVVRDLDVRGQAIAARIHDGRDISLPSQGRQVAVLPTLTAVKVMLYQGMREQGIGQAELARRLGWHLPPQPIASRLPETPSAAFLLPALAGTKIDAVPVNSTGEQA